MTIPMLTLGLASRTPEILLSSVDLPGPSLDSESDTAKACIEPKWRSDKCRIDSPGVATGFMLHEWCGNISHSAWPSSVWVLTTSYIVTSRLGTLPNRRLN